MADEEHRPKRSRFDQTTPEPRRQSRFDRRSRSPSSRQSEATRTRSPLSREPRSPGANNKADPVTAAGMFWVCFVWKMYPIAQLTRGIAAAAAKINAQLQAKKGIQHVDVPPIRAVS